ncbi:MAG: hypothetical protein M3Z18_06110, partial [Gemmatimonadota bacterium]|nr:hypothetical protein [Gemmatimonadota bacterium]
CASRNSAEDQHFADTIQSKEQLRQQGIEGSAALLYAPVGNRVPSAFGGGDSGKPQLPKIAGQSCLGHVPPPLEKKLAEIFLAADYP